MEERRGRPYREGGQGMEGRRGWALKEIRRGNKIRKGRP